MAILRTKEDIPLLVHVYYIDSEYLEDGKTTVLAGISDVHKEYFRDDVIIDSLATKLDMAIGLQQVDNLKSSKYLEKLLEENETRKLTNIKNNIDLWQVIWNNK